ncbi:hypothetical protein [Paenibacillus hemerocallicola]|uniref:hypothetical protein n=1 Tax=Paenibacillus hemerocallicola TaxID=1172614 RepID=UPI001C405BB5|nr:hypothetical protein [Paenibacillus hemerocallicola]
MTETSTIEQWHDYFGQMFEMYESRLRENFGAHFSELQQLAERCTATWPKALTDLYKIQLLIDLSSRIDEMYRRSQSSLYAYYYFNRLYDIAEKITERVVTVLSKADRQTIRTECADRLEETTKILHDYLCSNPQAVMNWLFSYRYIWWNLLHTPSLCDKEKVRLQRRLKGLGVPAKQLDLARLGIIHL